MRGGALTTVFLLGRQQRPGHCDSRPQRTPQQHDDEDGVTPARARTSTGVWPVSSRQFTNFETSSELITSQMPSQAMTKNSQPARSSTLTSPAAVMTVASCALSGFFISKSPSARETANTPEAYNREDIKTHFGNQVVKPLQPQKPPKTKKNPQKKLQQQGNRGPIG